MHKIGNHSAVTGVLNRWREKQQKANCRFAEKIRALETSYKIQKDSLDYVIDIYGKELEALDKKIDFIEIGMMIILLGLVLSVIL